MIRSLQLWKFVRRFLQQKKVNWKIINKKVHPNYTVAVLFPRKLWIPAWIVVYAAFWENKENTADTESKMSKEEIISKADELYKDTQYDAAYNLLYSERLSDNDDILWRLARVIYEKAGMPTTSKQDKPILLEEAFSYTKKALEINDNNHNAHRWYAILVDCVAKEKGTKERLIKSTESRQHMERAIQLCPTNPTGHYLLGVWCYTFADLRWYERQFASVVFATPPSSSFEEALQYFEKAEELEPNFYGSNLLMLAKCYLKLNQKEKAIGFLRRAKTFPPKTTQDKEVYKEAVELLKSLKAE